MLAVKRRGWRLIFLLLSIGCLLKIVFGEQPSPWAVAGFFLCGAAWYGLTWLRTRELDAPKPR